MLAVIGYDERTPFPGVAALVPTAGAALIVWAGQGGPTFIGRLLSLRPVVFVGLISYSLYLWHWPALVLANELGLGPTGRLAAVLAAFALAFASWRLIEQPIRHRALFATPLRLAGGLITAVLVLAIFGLGGHLSGGFKWACSGSRGAGCRALRLPRSEAPNACIYR